ncbi:MAG: hypothetical protein LUF35_10150 [Lachnospiraceae bacterium]|nr:hypothetical protein [Lachnospiraceae bacterium]
MSVQSPLVVLDQAAYLPGRFAAKTAPMRENAILYGVALYKSANKEATFLWQLR